MAPASICRQPACCCCGVASSPRWPCGCSCICTFGPTCRWCWDCAPGTTPPRPPLEPASSYSPGSISCCRCPSYSPWWRLRTSTEVSNATSAAAADTVVACARAGEPDRYLAALLAPPKARPHLLALAAFSSELARVPALVRHEPAMGAIRLQWWRDALEASDQWARTGNPVADAVRASSQTCQWPRAVLVEAIDAHELDLARSGLADDAAFAAYLWKCEGALFALAAGMLSGGHEADLRPAAVASGQAYGL